MKNKEELLSNAQKLRKGIEKLSWDKDICITISVGIAMRSEGEKMFKIADERLYISKQNGRNRVTD